MKEQIRNYIAENFLFSANGFPLEDSESLLEAGVVDSTGVMELVMFVEESYDIEVEDDEIVPENFDSVTNIITYVQRKQG